MMVASSTDLFHWTKHGRALPGLKRSRTGLVVCRREGERLVATKINGKYWMYWGIGCYVATSDDLIHWTPITRQNGNPISFLPPRKGYFDSGACEIGAIALKRNNGILITYNSVNRPADAGGDPSVPASWASLGQAVYDPNDPTRLIKRCERPFLTAELEWERKGIFDNVVVANGLVYFKNSWMIYYGAADKWTGMAVCQT
jgi:predicted GH43/DUF377 family glycosyl hydrolase